MTTKDQDIERLATELAELTGEDQTETLIKALREHLEREKRLRSREGIAEKLMAIGRHGAALPVLDDRDPDDMLYDEYGLPK